MIYNIQGKAYFPIGSTTVNAIEEEGKCQIRFSSEACICILHFGPDKKSQFEKTMESIKEQVMNGKKVVDISFGEALITEKPIFIGGDNIGKPIF